MVFPNLMSQEEVGRLRSTSSLFSHRMRPSIELPAEASKLELPSSALFATGVPSNLTALFICPAVYGPCGGSLVILAT